MYFSGYASVFNVKDLQNDVIVSGAFHKENMKNVKLLWQHDFRKPIGKILSIKPDERGLKIEGKIFTDTVIGRDAAKFITSQITNHMSIGFVTRQASYDKARGVRYVKAAKLYEVSIVTLPANQYARIERVQV